MTDERVVIIGAGQGGYQAAASLRDKKFQGSITLIGDEPGLPYQRPPLSKAFLKTGNEEKLNLRPATFYAKNDIDHRTDTRVISIDRDSKFVSTQAGDDIRYDHLILATGSRNRIPPVKGLALDGVFEIRTLSDARALRTQMPSIGHAIVIGGGFIGLEFAAVARQAGIAVTVIEGAQRLMSRAVSETTSDAFLQAHQAWGADIILNVLADEVIDDGTGKVSGVRLSDGRTIEGDTIILAAGIVPNSEIAKTAGLSTNNGIVVDEFLVSPDDSSISALGDCCVFPDPALGRPTRLESIQAASDHARTIAARLTGAPAAYSALPWFWSDQGNLKLQIAGLSAGADAWEVITNEQERLVVLCFRNDALCAVETINAAAEHMAGRKLLASKQRIDRNTLAQDGYDLRLASKRL